MKKTMFIFLVVLGLLTFPSSVLIAKASGISRIDAENALTKQTVAMRSMGAEVKGHIPQLKGLTNKSLEKEVNDAIDQAFGTFMNSMYDSTRIIEFSSDRKFSGDYFSILLYFKESSTLSDEKVATFVIDLKQEKMVYITDILGVNAVSLANHYITQKIAQNPEKYNANFTGITNTVYFYIENNNIILPFDKYKIAPGSHGIVTFELPINEIIEMTLSDTDYYQKQPYRIRMVRLNQFSEPFGYSFLWNGAKQEVTVQKGTENIALLTINTNAYYMYQGNRRVHKILEASPEIIRDNTYVPIGFIRETLGIFYTVNADQTITFSTWK